jgi:hypothetical protein
MALTLNGSTGVTFNDSSLQGAAASPFGLKNRIINGDMVIDQRNAGASVTPTSDDTYTLDRWHCSLSNPSKYSVQQVSSSVAGFVNAARITSLSSYSVAANNYFAFDQIVEGYNIADLAWGTANAKTVTLSFNVQSSLTGTFGGTIHNSDANRSYPFSYTISSANTATQISITIPGDTSGTWLTTNGKGLWVRFSLGVGSNYTGTAGAWTGSLVLAPTGSVSVVGTNAATWQITGVQLEVGSTATPFERRLISQELNNCYRYYYQWNNQNTYQYIGIGRTINSTYGDVPVSLPVPMRAIPTISYPNVNQFQTVQGTATSLTIGGNIGTQATGGVYTINLNINPGAVSATVACCQMTTTTTTYLGVSAEL